jgi:crotonobetainyl-CoA:carnitine CoA-transferase CaiB-like acyl-CoA transferase
LTSGAVREALADVLLTQPAAAWEAQTQAAGVPATRVVRPEDASAHLARLTGVNPTVELIDAPPQRARGAAGVCALAAVPRDAGRRARTSF